MNAPTSVILRGTPQGTPLIDVTTLRAWLAGEGEIAFVDVREEGLHGEGHPLLAVNVPYSRLEIDFPRLVPRPATRIVLLAEEGIGPSAARRLADLGYGDVHLVLGGLAAWEAAGEPLFTSVNVPSKAFAECVEHAYHTPDITAEELDRLIKSKADVVVLDSRTSEEFARFHVPGAISAPGPEIVHRFAELVPSPDTYVVVSCAGRTRGIIGAQALINAGVPNRVAALSGGTQGWRLAGLDLEREAPPPPRQTLGLRAREEARKRADALGVRFGVPVITPLRLAEWRDDPARTTYVFDVRQPEEYTAGHAMGSVSAQGGQLVQALDKWVGTRGARIVLTDDDGVRAIVTAHWLRQLGWDVSVLPGLISGTVPAAGHGEVVSFPRPPRLMPDEAKAWLDAGAALISADASEDYRRGHPGGAIWTNRSRLPQLPPEVCNAVRIVVAAADVGLAELVARDLRDDGLDAAVLAGGAPAWREAGLEVVATPGEPPDDERIDTLFWLHDRHGGNLAASRAYLDWELGLPAAVAKSGTTGFRIGPVV
ncbi:rhodanese-like domain-containing protein [Chelatococcus sp. YT9]|uniref:rhodanese-like domain-containing protein n=1 Tax=Chelatococcus sp. YT9 TaxID=2835635 RepID=UPI001BCCF1CC|nr:rhodanese-like domain-containing protein [Chelatococcus sp. YT9]MBS7699065.1 sulfurtransferase [Chelatococcus sp. YT9]